MVTAQRNNKFASILFLIILLSIIQLLNKTIRPPSLLTLNAQFSLMPQRLSLEFHSKTQLTPLVSSIQVTFLDNQSLFLREKRDTLHFIMETKPAHYCLLPFFQEPKEMQSSEVLLSWQPFYLLFSENFNRIFQK